jgi:signal recognition particle subunit SRP54
MFDSLQERLQRTFKSLRGQAVLNEENMQETLRELRLALLEADVNFKVVKQFIDQVQAKAVGQSVATALSPGEQVIKIVRDELIEILGKDTARVRFASQPPTVVLMAGLQGSGKTTTSGKLAHWFKNGGHRPLLVSVDVYRPAAREQLKVVAQAIKAQIYEGHVVPDAPVRGGADEGVRPYAGQNASANTATVERLAKEARREAINSGCDVLIVDTAGRLHIDDQLMEEMQSLKRLLNPQEILFVADAMTGQDAVRSADEFHKKLTLTGVVLTKMDGDARGGAALSIRNVTGAPIKFIGVGEKYDALEPFHPDRIVSRILGMGDILSLIERAEQTVDKKKAQDMAARALSGDGFSLEDFREQLRQVKKMGSMQNLMGMLPSVGPFAGLQKHADKIDEKQINHVEAIINSMTAHERHHHDVINGSRRKRIARGSGTTVQEVNNLLRQYAQMRKMFKQMGKGNFMRRMAGMKMQGM